MADAKRDLPRTAEADEQARIKEEISILEKQIAQQQEIFNNPEGAQERVQKSIQQGLERIHEPDKPVQVVANSRFINQPPLTPPTWFQDRHAETAFLGDFLKDEALRLVTIVGRGGVGKTALTCRILRSLQKGHPAGKYRTTPLGGLFAREKGGFYHDGRFASYLDVVNHYNNYFSLKLTELERHDLVEFLKSL